MGAHNPFQARGGDPRQVRQGYLPRGARSGTGSGLTGTVVAFTVMDCTIAALLFTDWQVDIERAVS